MNNKITLLTGDQPKMFMVRLSIFLVWTIFLLGAYTAVVKEGNAVFFSIPSSSVPLATGDESSPQPFILEPFMPFIHSSTW